MGPRLTNKFERVDPRSERRERCAFFENGPLRGGIVGHEGRADQNGCEVGPAFLKGRRGGEFGTALGPPSRRARGEGAVGGNLEENVLCGFRQDLSVFDGHPAQLPRFIGPSPDRAGGFKVECDYFQFVRWCGYDLSVSSFCTRGRDILGVI